MRPRARRAAFVSPEGTAPTMEAAAARTAKTAVNLIVTVGLGMGESGELRMIMDGGETWRKKEKLLNGDEFYT